MNRYFIQEWLTHRRRCPISLVSKGMQTEAIMRYHCKSTAMAKMEKTSNTNAWWECGVSGVLLESGMTTLENCLAVSYKIKHIFTIQFSNFIPRYLSQKTKTLCPYKDLYTNAHIRFRPNHPKLEGTQTSIRRRMG